MEGLVTLERRPVPAPAVVLTKWALGGGVGAVLPGSKVRGTFSCGLLGLG